MANATIEDNDHQEEQMLLKPPAKKPEQPVVVNKTGIAARLQHAVKAAKPVNRSSDLVPLSQEYDVMRKALKALIGSAKSYHAAMVGTDKARLDMTMKMSSLSAKSPIFEPIGNTANGDSVASVAQAASRVAEEYTASFQEKVIDYCVEWERVVTSRVDAEMKETNKLHALLNHYQKKVDTLRINIHVKEDKGKKPSKSLTEKMERNEKKLEQAWGNHERASSKLCNLMEEVVKRGWKDLYALVRAAIQFEVQRSSNEYDAFSRLPVVTDDLASAYEEAMRVGPGEHEPSVIVALAAIDEDDDDVEETTTGSFHDEEVVAEDTSANGVLGEEEDYVAPATPASPKRSGNKVDDMQAPLSPRGVAQV